MNVKIFSIFLLIDLILGGSGFGSSMMGSFMQSQAARYGSQGGSSGLNNFQSVFGSSDTPPTLLDMSEFPSLTNARGQNEQHSNVLQAPGSKPYGMNKNFIKFI